LFSPQTPIIEDEAGGAACRVLGCSSRGKRRAQMVQAAPRECWVLGGGTVSRVLKAEEQWDGGEGSVHAPSRGNKLMRRPREEKEKARRLQGTKSHSEAGL
jgi:hypothetical protein